MQSKRECLAKFQQFLLDVSKGKGIHSLTVPLGFATPIRVSHFRSDCGGEFTSHAFLEYARVTNITLENSTPVESHAYVAERHIRSLKEGVRSILHESGLQDPLLFYSDALVYTAYTRLRIPRGDGESPIQKWQRLCGHPTAMDLSHLRVFGSECTVHIPRHKRDKSGYTAVFG